MGSKQEVSPGECDPRRDEGNQAALDAAQRGPEPFSPTPGEITVGEMKDAVGYDPEGEGSVDDLIAYKDALEDRLVSMIDETGKPKMAAIINEQVIELDDDVLALIAATFRRDADTIEAPGETWEKLNAIFPESLAPDVDQDGITRIEVKS